MPSRLPKDEFTQQLRECIAQLGSAVVETDRTEPDLTALSDECSDCPNRGIYVSTYHHEIEGITVDLEERDGAAGDHITIEQVQSWNTHDVIQAIRRWMNC